MIILISPTKTFTKNTDLATNIPLFMNKTNYLIEKIKSMSFNDLKESFKLSDKLTEQTIDFYNNINNKYKAIYQYGGTAFKYIDPYSLSSNSLDNIYILSGLYGILNANTGISPYRLEISNNRLGNLYDYWKDDVNNYLKSLNKPIINLASTEYSKHLDFKNIDITTINFIERKNNKDSSNSMMLKKMRGLFVKYISNNNITNLEEIKSITLEGFIFNSDLSNNKNIIFLKEIIE